MKTIEEKARSMADWILRRAPILKYYGLTKMFADMLTEQREEDLEVFCQWLTDFANTIYWEVESPSSSKPLGEIFKEQIKMRLGIFEKE